MSDRLLVVTNILIYAVDEDSEYHHQSLDLIQNSNYELFLTSKNVTEFFVALTRAPDIHISSRECLECLDSLMFYFHVICPNQDSLEKLKYLIYKYNPCGLWIHDLEIISIAMEYSISRIVTKNLEDFEKVEEIDVITL
jgi:predicted nucleic acid-binding protein